MITTVAQLVAALKAGVAGGVLTLAPGTYPDATIRDVHPAAPVVVSSADPSNPAIFTGAFKLLNSSNLVFRSVVFNFAGASDPYWPGRLSKLSNVTLDHVRVTSNGPDISAGGFLAADTDGLTVSNSTFDHLGSVALNVARATRLTITDNEFSFWNKSAVGIGQVRTLVFSRNRVHDAFPSPGVHPDGLQIFTFGSKVASSDLTVTDNRMWIGKGGAFQGVFFGDETGNLAFHNVSIERNSFRGTMWNSIYVKKGSGTVRILDNTAFSSREFNPTATKDPANPVFTDFRAGIMVWTTPDADLTEAGNRAQIYADADGRPLAMPPGNIRLTQDPFIGGGAGL